MSTNLPDIIHLLICKLPHEYDILKYNERTPQCCYYYLENDIAGSMTLPNHLQWAEVTSKLKTSLSLGSDKEAMEFIRRAIALAQDLRELVGENDNRLNFIKGLLL